MRKVKKQIVKKSAKRLNKNDLNKKYKEKILDAFSKIDFDKIFKEFLKNN